MKRSRIRFTIGQDHFVSEGPQHLTLVCQALLPRRQGVADDRRLGMPISTTHSISTAIMGVGCARRFSALNWTLVERILWTWVLTVPATFALAYGLLRLGAAFGWTR